MDDRGLVCINTWKGTTYYCTQNTEHPIDTHLLKSLVSALLPFYSRQRSLPNGNHVWKSENTDRILVTVEMFLVLFWSALPRVPCLFHVSSLRFSLVLSVQHLSCLLIFSSVMFLKVEPCSNNRIVSNKYFINHDSCACPVLPGCCPHTCMSGCLWKLIQFSGLKI